MTTVSRVNTVTHSSVSGGGEWDHRLNRLLEDLQETVVPPETKENASEYREYRMFSSVKANDEPAQTTQEKWVEYGSRHPTSGHSERLPALSDSAYNSTSSREKTINFSENNYLRNYGSPSPNPPAWGSDSYDKTSQVEFLNPANTMTVLNPGDPTQPKVERKEFYAKSSYTSLIKGGPGDGPSGGFEPVDRRPERFVEEPPRSALPDYPRPSGVSSSLSESRRTFTSETTRGTSGIPAPPPSSGPALYSSPPVKANTSSVTREVITDRSVTPPPPPSEGLKTPPLVRKILQSSTSTSNYHSSNTKTTGGPGPYDSQKPLAPLSSARPPLSTSPGIPNYDEPPETRGARYYTSTTTRTEHRENREVSPVKRFPSPNLPRDNYGEPPKRLDDLMATFENSSYTHTRNITSDGGPHKPHPYGPGTHPVEPVRQVRIDDNVTQRTISVDDEPELTQRKNATNYQNPAYGKEVEPTRNVAGPPVYYPSNQVFQKTEEESLMSSSEGGKGKMKAKRKAEYKAKEKMKQSHKEDKGGGVVPVPVCLPVCCAAPCSIQ